MTSPPDREAAVYNTARRMPTKERPAYLDKACSGDPALRQRVEELLEAGEEAGAFLADPACAGQRSPAAADPEKPTRTLRIESLPSETVGDRIGRYKLLQQIGEGGCGIVYMAEQTEPVRRRVALKVIKLGMDTKSVIARFEAERQALALMDHPNIARVLDAGATHTGRPYFVMELVKGIKITDYCDQKQLSTRERLNLFVQVCQAVQHAHQKGVIHRDIKPSNILVTSRDGISVPKVIDFGIAKATTDQPLTDKTLFTAFEQFLGTPAYMSPEQAEMSELGIDTRSDIYSLGVLLYELLTGKTPFDPTKLLKAGLDAMRRTIREEEPARPSTRLSTMLDVEQTTAATHRHTEALKLIHLLRGDLDWIVMKALEKDRARRYETANGLAMDIDRHLNNEPVSARPPSRLYEFQKTVRRHKFGFAAAGAIVATLMIGLAASTWEFLKERHARQRAVTEAAKATAISEFLQKMLRAANPDDLKGSDYTVRQLLDDFSRGLTNQLAGQPEVEATVRLAIGSTYFRLGIFSKAEPDLRSALELRRTVLGPDHPDTLDAQHWLAKGLVEGQRKYDEGVRVSREAWQARSRVLGAQDLRTLDTQELYEEALFETDHLQEAEAIARQVFQVRKQVQGTNNVDTLNSLGNLGMVISMRGDRPQGEQYVRESLTGYQRIGLADTHDGILCAKELASMRLLQGDPVEAERLLVEVRPRAIKTFGADKSLTLFVQRLLVRALAEQGQKRMDEAERLGKETLKALLRTRADQEDVAIGRTMLYLGRVLVEKNKLEEAAPLLREALTLLRQPVAAELRPELPAQAANWLGTIQLAQKLYPEAEMNMLSGADSFLAAKAEMSLNERRIAIGHMVNLYHAWGKGEEEAAWQKKLDTLAPIASSR